MGSGSVGAQNLGCSDSAPLRILGPCVRADIGCYVASTLCFGAGLAGACAAQGVGEHQGPSPDPYPRTRSRTSKSRFESSHGVGYEPSGGSTFWIRPGRQQHSNRLLPNAHQAMMVPGAS